MAHHEVHWIIDVDAESPQDAISEAMEYFQDHEPGWLRVIEDDGTAHVIDFDG